jgi:hypothetical protein
MGCLDSENFESIVFIGYLDRIQYNMFFLSMKLYSQIAQVAGMIESSVCFFYLKDLGQKNHVNLNQSINL